MDEDALDTLDGRQKQALHAALLRAFPRQPARERLVEFHLDTRLSIVAGEGPLADVVYRLIEWAEAQGRVDALVAGAREVNPGNPHLAEFERLLREPRPERRSPTRPLVRAVTGQRPGCVIAITLALVAALAIPLWKAARLGGGAGTGPPKVSSKTKDVPRPAEPPGRRVEVEVRFTWRSRGQAPACRSDEQWQRELFAGESIGDWPRDEVASRDVQLVSLLDEVQIEAAQVFISSGRTADAVATGQPRTLVRKWRFPTAVTMPVRMAVCLQSQSRPPQPALRVSTWTHDADRQVPQGR